MMIISAGTQCQGQGCSCLAVFNAIFVQSAAVKVLTASAAGPVIIHPLECTKRNGADVIGLVAAVVWVVRRARVAVVGP